MPRLAACAVALLAAIYVLAPSVAAELPIGDGYYCEGLYQEMCFVCTQWHTHYAPPPQTGSEEHCHHAYMCYTWINGRCEDPGEMT